MKFVLAILCSLMLTAMPVVVSASAVCANAPRACCAHGKTMPCCAVKNSSAPQNAPAVPAQNNSLQNQIPVPALTVVIFALPEVPGNTISSTTVSPSFAICAPLFARDCAFLI
ncbi:MAG TPA: hypothetical protein VFV23_08090 [Verrucomicrobiae bacterium]|nr:hypothetical protein [Verrucomicrobiae bacterium]